MNKYRRESYLAQQARQREVCMRKVRYSTLIQAHANRGGLEAYACPFCGGAHLTGTVGKTVKLIRSGGRAIL